MANKMTKPLKERVSPRKYQKHLEKLAAHRDENGKWHKNKVNKKGK